ncbi:MAG: hypothetical protein LH630_01895 [Actinomycetia bacterium]|nr:hypothetical protein [Actinomycetes bacterium]
MSIHRGHHFSRLGDPTTHPYDDSPCWDGEWTPVTPAPTVDMWAHRALLRTVAAWPALHPWHLGDDKGSRRSLVWNAVPVSSAVPVDESVIDASQGLAVLTQTAPPPALSLGDVGADGEVLGGTTRRASSSMTGALLSALASGLSHARADAVADAVRQPADVIDSCRR